MKTEYSKGERHLMNGELYTDFWIKDTVMDHLLFDNLKEGRGTDYVDLNEKLEELLAIKETFK